MAGTEIANAYVALTVKAPGIVNDLKSELGGSAAQGAMRQVGTGLGDRLTSSVNRVLKTAFKASLVTTAGLAIGAIGTALSKGFQRISAIDTAQAKLRGLGHDAKTVDQIMSDALASVKGTAFGLGDAATVAAQAVAAGVKPGKDLEGVLKTVANTAAAAGTDLGDMGSIFAKAMSQANGVQNDVISQLADRGIPIYQALADQLGVTAGEVFKLASQGKIDFETFAAAAQDAGGNVASEMGTTWTGMWDNMLAAAGRFGEKVLGGIFPQLKTGMGDLTGWIDSIAPVAEDVGAKLGAFAADAIPKLVDGFKVAGDVIKNVFGWIKSNIDWLGPLAVGIGTLVAGIYAWVTATNAVKAAQLALAVVMNANPIMLIVSAIAALVAGLVWFFTKTETGKKIWAAFTKFLTEAWENVSSFFVTVWENYLKPVFDAIGAVFTWLWENIISPIVTLVINYFRVWGAIFTWLWTNVVQPVFSAIGDIFTWIWETIIRPVVDFVVAYFRIWGAIATWLWKNVIQPVFKSIGDVFTWIWDSIISPIVDWISDKINVLGLGFRILYEKFVKPAFESISSKVSSVWNWIDEHVFTPFKTGIGLIGTAFENGAKAIGKAWSKIKAAAAKPINFVLDTVWNDGLRSFWNDVMDELNLKDLKLPKADLIKFASGGVLPGYTPGRDVHEFYSPTGGRLALSGGEAIMRPEFTKAVGGPAGVARLNRMARNGQAFKDGGVWDNIKSFAGDVWDNVKEAASVAWEFLSDPAGAIQKRVVDGIIKPLLKGGGDNVFVKAVGALPSMAVKQLAQFFPSAKSSGSKGMGWEAMWKIVQNAIPDAVMTGGYRSPSRNKAVGGVSGSYHTQGRAIDLTPATMKMFDKVKALFPNATELIYTPAGDKQLLNGKPHSGWSDYVKRIHYNHIHLAMANGGVVPKLYDQGGWLPHGGMAVNRSGRPEAVLSPSESRALRAGLSGPSELVVVDADGALVGRMRVEAQREIGVASERSRRVLRAGRVGV